MDGSIYMHTGHLRLERAKWDLRQEERETQHYHLIAAQILDMRGVKTTTSYISCTDGSNSLKASQFVQV